MTEGKQKPEHKIRAGRWTASIWDNTNKEGKKYKSVTLQKNYKVGDKWESQSVNLIGNDIPNAVLALNKAFEHIVAKEPEE